jgi:regulator of sigma E protease
MLSQPPLWFILIAFLAALGPLVFIHELGHYLVARWFGVGAESFSIGFGREIAGWTDKRGTRWKVGWLPLGGYVKFVGDLNPVSMPGEFEEDMTAEERRRSFHHRPVWQRFLIVLAGPLANFLLAIAIFAAFFAMLGIPRTANVVTAIAQGSPAQAAGIRPGDRIISIAGRGTPTFEDISQVVALRPGAKAELRIERGGRPLSLPAKIGVAEEKDRFGQVFKVGRLGIYGGQRQYARLPAAQLVPAASAFTWSMTRSIVDALGQIITGRRSVKELGGPLKMAQIAGQQASLGLFEFVYLVALFSINLGFINLLPVPMLDGGHLALYSIEAVRRRPVSLQAQEWAFRGGLALLLALLLFTTLNDLGSFGLWERVGRLIG